MSKDKKEKKAEDYYEPGVTGRAGMKLCLAYTYISLLYFIVIGSLSIYVSNHTPLDKLKSSPVTGQIRPDWKVLPYVELQTVDATDDSATCGDGWEPIFARTFNGINDGCDCYNACDPSSDQDLCNNFNPGITCSNSMLQAGCKQVRPWPAIYQSILTSKSGTEKLICGKPGGETFENVIRASTIGNCPSNYSPCNPNASPENKLCYPAG